MVHQSLCLAKIMSLAATTLLLGFSLPAKALTLSQSSGIWSNVISTDSLVEFQILGNETQVRWGDPGFIGSTINDKSGLGFQGVGSTPIELNTPFAVGTLRHFNKTVYPPSPTAADLAVNLLFSDPAGLSPSFNFGLAINETPNTPATGTLCPVGDPPCPDLVGISDAFASQFFLLDGVEYTLQLLGFQNASGEIISQFVSAENGTENTAILYAQITAPPPPVSVPEPGMAIATVSILGMYWGSRCVKTSLRESLIKPEPPHSNPSSST